MPRNKLFSMLLLALAVAAFPACDKDAPSGSDILPGLGLQAVRIGDEAKKAFDEYGPTTTAYIESNGQPNLSDATTDTYTTLGIAFTYDAAEKSEGVGVSKF